VEDCDVLNVEFHTVRCQEVGGLLSLPCHLNEDTDSFISVHPVCLFNIHYSSAHQFTFWESQSGLF